MKQAAKFINNDTFQNILDWYLARKWRMSFIEYMTVKIEDELMEEHTNEKNKMFLR